MDGYSVVKDAGGNIYVTRSNMHGKLVMHQLACKEYSVEAISKWLEYRLHRVRNSMVQDAFPNMNADDREFLMTGITPGEWLAMFPNERNGEDE